MLEHKGHFYAVEPNHGQLIKITPGGHAEQLIDISATQGHAVPTAMAFHDGAFYVGTLSTFPIQPGAATVLKISETGELLEVMHGFTAVTSYSVGPDCIVTDTWGGNTHVSVIVDNGKGYFILNNTSGEGDTISGEARRQ